MLRLLTPKLMLMIILISFSCRDEEEQVRVSVMPLNVGAELHFRGFVTDSEEELVSQIHNFSRKVVYEDTLSKQPIFAYISNNKKTKFYTEANGTVWQYHSENLGDRILQYGLSYKQPVVLSYWEILLKVDEGVGTEWSVLIDTTFDAVSLDGKPQRIQYLKQGEGRYEGWTETFIPEPNTYNYVPVVDAHWYELNTYLLNQTTGDTLFSSSGTAHQYFEPDLGSIKYISDFTKTEIGQPTIPLHGTWELMAKDIPE